MNLPTVVTWPLQPNPTRDRRHILPDTVRRRLDCVRYGGCLNAVLARDWPGFHCDNCPAYVPLSWAAREREAVGLLDLALAVLA